MIFLFLGTMEFFFLLRLGTYGLARLFQMGFVLNFLGGRKMFGIL